MQCVIKRQPNEVVTIIISISQVRKLSYGDRLTFLGLMSLSSQVKNQDIKPSLPSPEFDLLTIIGI